MKLIVISEKRLDELVEAMLAKLELDSSQPMGVVEEVISFRRVNYDVRVLVDELKGGETL